MKSDRRLVLESLETRRLLAVGCEVASPVEALSSTEMAEGESVSRAENVEPIRARFNNGDFYLPAPFPRFLEPDTIHEVGNRLFVVDRPYEANNNLILLERAQDGTLEEIEKIEIGFGVTDVFVKEDQVLILGNSLHLDIPGEEWQFPKALALTVHFGNQTEVVRQELEGTIADVFEREDDFLIVQEDPGRVYVAIYPPPPRFGNLTSYELTNEGLVAKSTVDVPMEGIRRLAANGDFYALSTERTSRTVIEDDQPLPIFETNTVLYRYSGAEFADATTLDMGPGYVTELHISEDGQSGFAVRTHYGELVTTTIDLLDLSNNSISVFESIAIEESTSYVVGVNDHGALLLDRFNQQTLRHVNLDQSIDLSAEARLTEIEIPDQLTLGFHSLQVSDDALIFTAFEVPEDEPTGVPSGGSEIVSFSITTGEVLGRTELDGSEVLRFPSFVLLDPPTGLFSFSLSRQNEDAVFETVLVYGRLNTDGQFVEEGQIASEPWRQIESNSERLIGQDRFGLTEYDLSNPDAPPIITPLVELEPIKAVDDEFTLPDDGVDQIVDVLANDRLNVAPWPYPTAEIVDLIGAPAGAEVVDRLGIRIPGEALSDVDSLRFEYVLSDGVTQSTAVVEIDVTPGSTERVEELVQQIRERASADLRAPLDDISVTNVERIFGQPLPVVLPDGTEIDLSPGILVLLRVGNENALYAASLEGEIVQAFVTESEQNFLVELGLRAVNEIGEVLSEIAVGDTFWLEFTASDLRETGIGVFAAFFDLIVPTENLVLTGPVEYGEGFQEIAQGGFSEGEVDDFGAIGEVAAPSNEPNQVLLRIQARATGVGNIVLQPEPADQRGTETLLRGIDDEIDPSRVRFNALTLSIVNEVADPMDANGDGSLTPLDALVILNFLGIYGTTELSDLATRVSEVRGEAEMTDEALDRMRLLDTNQSGFISAVDALRVINAMNTAALQSSLSEDEDEDAEGEILQTAATLF